MPKAIISNRIYLDVTPELSAEIRKALTYRIRKPPRPGLTKFSMFDVVKNYKVISAKVLSIPSARVDLIPEHYEIVDKRTKEDYPFPDPKLPMYEEQQKIYDDVDDMCFINAMVGFGKTFLALHIARKLGQKTLVVCHTTVLRDQWIEEAERLYGMPIGKIGTGVVDMDHSLVVGNIQTLSKMLPRVAKEFGTVIVDESHHISATTFTEFLDGMYARYKIGLSGTMTRKDGRQVLFRDFFGTKVYQPAQSNTMTPSVKIVQTGLALSPGDPWAIKINKLLYDENYQNFIAAMAMGYMEKGHKVLVVADRVEFINNIGVLIGEKCVCITGETDETTRKAIKQQVESGEKDCVAGSRQIISEGWSVNPLSLVILASPISAPPGGDGLLEQIIGRIQRQYPDKLEPIVVDMNFCGPADRKQNNERKAFYMRKGWEIQGIS